MLLKIFPKRRPGGSLVDETQHFTTEYHESDKIEIADINNGFWFKAGEVAGHFEDRTHGYELRNDHGVVIDRMVTSIPDDYEMWEKQTLAFLNDRYECESVIELDAGWKKDYFDRGYTPLDAVDHFLIRDNTKPCDGDCGMNYCDENGCTDRKVIKSEPIPPSDNKKAVN